MERGKGVARLAWAVENAAKDEADIWVYDVIGADGFWEEGVASADFAKELRGLNVSRLNLHINSPGGYVNDALAMFTALQSHPAYAKDSIYGYVEGSADSCASFLLQAANHRLIAKNASMTIHEGHTFAMGNAKDFRLIADELDATSENIASIYAERAGGTTAEWRDRMLANGGGFGTTYRGQAAVDIGLCDEVGIASRNAAPQRIAAYFRPTAQVAAPTDSPTTIASEVAAALSAAKLTPPAPSLQQLLEEHQREPLSAAFTRR